MPSVSTGGRCHSGHGQYGPPAIPGNMTKDSHDWCTRIYTCLTFLSESVTNFVYWHIDVSSGRLQCTCRTTAHQYLKLLHDSTCIQPLVTGWWFRNIGSARTAVGHSLSLARWPSTLCPMSCATLPSISIGWRSLFALLPKVYTLRRWWFWILEWKCSASWTSSNRSWTTASADRLPHRSLVPSSTWTTQNLDRSHPKPIAVLHGRHQDFWSRGQRGGKAEGIGGQTKIVVIGLLTDEN